MAKAPVLGNDPFQRGAAERPPAAEPAARAPKKTAARDAADTRADGEAFMRVAAEVPLVVHHVPYALADADRALADLRAGRFSGAAVLRVSPTTASTP